MTPPLSWLSGCPLASSIRELRSYLAGQDLARNLVDGNARGLGLGDRFWSPRD